MKGSFQFEVLGLAGLVLALLALPALAQVPQHGTFSGRLVDDLGNPLVGPVDLELRVFDDETAGTEIYAELHSGVPLDDAGSFAVQFGLGAPLRSTLPPGAEAADLFAEVPRWLEVVVGLEALTPRQLFGSVPWALIAQQANKLVPDPNAPRFEDCGDGTVADHQTGLQWEMKTGILEPYPEICFSSGCPDPHDLNQVYQWDSFGSDEGGAFINFLARLNGEFDPEAATGCFADHCDWELPKIAELQTILDCSSGAPCIDPIFGPTGGVEWSASTDPTPSLAWSAFFGDGSVNLQDKTTFSYVRAVRTGSCTH